jgi:hypothetical protein
MVLNASYVSLQQSRFVENHLIWILEDGLLIFWGASITAYHKETWHAALILLIIKSLVKQKLNFNKLRMLRLLPTSSYIPQLNFFAIAAT